MRKLFFIIILLLSSYNIYTINFDRNFYTDFDKSSIDLKMIIRGGPGKDGIPAINNPKFNKIEKSSLKDDSLGILVTIDGESKFYPFNILVWHEIVNDKIGDSYISVTFCPLCGSAIAFNRKFDGIVHRFGVSGYLHESNLLMYDDVTESFWSQSMGEAVIGEYLGKKLEVLDVSLLEFNVVKEQFPKALILSKNTGFKRKYDYYPYGDYEISLDMYFPVSRTDNTYHAKEMMYVVSYKGISFSFPLKQFKSGYLKYTYKNTNIDISSNDGVISFVIDGVNYPGYYEMWFSWFIHHIKDGIVIDIIK